MIQLDEMTSSEFQRYLNFAVKDYANEHVKAGNWTEEEAIDRATKDYERLLPEKEKTANNKLFTIRDGNQEVGIIWLAKKSDKKAYIYDITIEEEFQGRGYGKQTMKEIEKVAIDWGVKNIELHVFGHNKVARGLYEKMGYIEKNIIMNKTL